MKSTVFLLSFLFVRFASAGALEALSMATNEVWHPLTFCSKMYDEKRANEGLTKAANCQAAAMASGPHLESQQKALAAIAAKSDDQAEDRFFSLCAVQHAQELQCATDFAEKITAKSSASEESFGTVVSFVQRLRVARQSLVQAVKEMMSTPGLGARQCPLTLDDLQPDPGFTSEKPDRHFTLCQTILSSRGAYNEIMAAIPLSDLPLVKKDVEHFANLPDGAAAKAAEAELSNHLRDLYGKSKDALAGESQRLLDSAAKGGATFDRTARYDLLSDPKMVEKVVKDGGGGQDLQRLACKTNARYGQGADSLDKTIFVGSLMVGFGTGAALKVGAGIVKASNFAYVARASGLISLTGERVVQTGSLALGAAGNAAAAYPSIIKACSTNSGPKYSAKSADHCVSAPKISELEHDNCILTKSLALLGFTGTAAAGYKLAKSGVAAAAQKVAGVAAKEEGAVVAGTNAERASAGEASAAAKRARSDELKAPDVDIPETHRPTAFIPDSGRQVDANEIISGGRMPASADEVRKHIASDDYRDGVMTMLVVRDKKGSDHLLYDNRLADESKILNADGKEVVSHRTLRQKWRDEFGEEPNVVAAGECITHMAGVIYGCINQSGSFFEGNGSPEYLADVAQAYGFKKDSQTLVKGYDINAAKENRELGHLNAEKAILDSVKINTEHRGYINDLRSFSKKLFTEHAGEKSGMTKPVAMKVVQLRQKPDPSWSDEKKKAYSMIASVMPLFRENAFVTAVKSTEQYGKDVELIRKYLPEYYQDITKP